MCYYRLAYSAKEESTCLLIKGGNRESCLKGVATLKNDPKICNQIKGPNRDTCYLAIASDPNACDKIKDKNLRTACRRDIIEGPRVAPGFIIKNTK